MKSICGLKWNYYGSIRLKVAIKLQVLMEVYHMELQKMYPTVGLLVLSIERQTNKQYESHTCKEFFNF